MLFSMKKSSFIIKSLLICFIIVVVVIGNILFFPQAMPSGEYKLIIEKKQNLHLLAKNLNQDRVIKSSLAFRILVRVLNKDTKITAGMYILKKPI